MIAMTGSRPVKSISHWGAIGAIVLITFLWGGSFSAIQYSVQAGIDVPTLLVLRFGLGALGLAVLLLVLRTPIAWPALRDGLILGVVVTGGFWFQAEGLRHTTVPKSSFITGLFVLFTPVVATFFGERIKRHHAVAVLVSILGLYALTRSPGAYGGWNLGDLDSLFGAMLFGAQVYLIARYARRSNPLVVAFGQAAGTAILAALLCIFWPVPGAAGFAFAWTPGAILAVAFLGIVATALASGVQCTMQAKLGATEAAVLFTLEPLFATLIALTGLVPGIHDRLSLVQWAGALILLAGPVLAERGAGLFRRPG